MAGHGGFAVPVTTGSVTGASVTHRRAAVADLEAATRPDPSSRLESLLARDGVAEAFLLQTCNRVEEYVVTAEPADGGDALDDFAPGVTGDAVVHMGHLESLEHLLRVAAGLDSQVLGEDEILGQVRRAYRLADRAGALGDILDPAVLKAIHVGERARSETGINEGIVSLGSAAVRLADRDPGLAGRDVVLVGAGGIAKTIASSVIDHDPASLTIVNRSVANAEALAADLAADAATAEMRTLPSRLGAADVAFTATGSDEPVIAPGDLPAGGDLLLLVDLGQPRDVDRAAADRADVTVLDLDDLRPVTESTAEERAEAADAVESIVQEELELLLDQHKRARADEIIAAMYRGADHVKRREVANAITKLEAEGPVDDREREVVEALADALVSQLLAVPTRSLREAALEDDWETVTGAIRLFDPGVDVPREFFVPADQGSSADAGED